MPRACVLCKQQQSSSLSVFRFPTSLDHQAAWVRIIRNALPNFAETSDAMNTHMKNGICEMHFDKKDISRGKQKCRLKKDVIPFISGAETSFIDSPHEPPFQDKYTQTDGFCNMLQFTSETIGEERQISVCAICRRHDVYYGHRLNDCDKFVLHIVSEVCLLDRTSYESEICSRCIGIISEIVQFKKEIKYRTQMLLNFATGDTNNRYSTVQKVDVINKKYDGLVRPVGDQMITVGKQSEYCPQAKQKTTYNCSICLKVFYTRQLHLLHEASHKQCFDCVICGRYLTTKARLQLHLYKFHDIGEAKKQPHRCSVCERTFGTRAGLKYHQTVLHSSDTSYKCQKCDKTFKSRLLYKSHLLFSHGEKKVPCDICSKKFFTVSKRNTHVNAVHRNAATWLCRRCGGKFTSNTAFRHHVRSKHITDSCSFKKRSTQADSLCKKGAYTCPECGITFANVSSFNVHVTTCQKNKDNMSFLPKYDSELVIFDDVNYAATPNVLPLESIKLIEVMEKSDSCEADLSSDIPLVGVNLLDGIDSTHGQSIYSLHSPHEDPSDVSGLPLIGAHQGMSTLLPLPQSVTNAAENLPLERSVNGELNAPVLPNTEDIEFDGLHFSESGEDALQQVSEIEIPAIPLDDPGVENEPVSESGPGVIDQLPLPQDGMAGISFGAYHQRPLDDNSLSDHLGQMGGESEICGLARDKDWNIPLVLDHNEGMAFGAHNIAASIDIPLCEEQNVLVDGHVSLGNDLSEYSLPPTDQSSYVIDYLTPSSGDDK